jgi:hypothetical protein
MRALQVAALLAVAARGRAQVGRCFQLTRRSACRSEPIWQPLHYSTFHFLNMITQQYGYASLEMQNMIMVNMVTLRQALKKSSLDALKLYPYITNTTILPI